MAGVPRGRRIGFQAGAGGVGGDRGPLAGRRGSSVASSRSGKGPWSAAWVALGDGRSNKLMFDEESHSLWSSLGGVPVVGPLVGTGLRLPFRSVVTTTWGEWKRQHPATTVLSLDTGYERDYGEGAAYRDYFSTDRLMFEVPGSDTRLKNKAEVLVVRPEVIGDGALPVAIAVERLLRQPVFSFEAAGRGFVVITSTGGSNLLFERRSHTFPGRAPDGSLRDAAGGRWRVGADGLVSEAGERLARIPAHRAFWFGWVAQYPRTELYK